MNPTNETTVFPNPNIEINIDPTFKDQLEPALYEEPQPEPEDDFIEPQISQ